MRKKRGAVDMVKYFITRQRKNEIKDIVLEIMKNSTVNSLPIKLNDIIKTYKIKCIKMDKITPRSSKSASGTNDDGYIIKSDESYIIFYNPTHSRQRIRYTLACQLSHIFLGHILNGVSDKKTDMEASYFADELLMPLSVLDSYGARSAADIMKRCDVSYTAAKIRQRDFVRRDKYKKVNGETDYDIRFLNQFFSRDDNDI